MNIYINRELSWIKFNKRVLEESQSSSVPKFERMKFISIFTYNFDEFFMVRAGSMYDRSLLINDVPDNKTGMSSKEQFEAIFRDTQPLYRLRDIYFKNVRAELCEHGICHRNTKDLSADETRYVKQLYKREILPLLSPQIIDAKHPLPNLENKKIYIFVSLKKNDKNNYGIVPISPMIERIIYLPSEDNKRSYLLVEDVILKYVGYIFKNYTIQSRSAIKITRNADVEVEDNFSEDDIDYRDFVKLIIKKRDKLAPIRLEFYTGVYRQSNKPIKYLSERLSLKQSQCLYSETPLDMSYVYALEERLQSESGNNSELFYTPLIPQYRRDFNPFKSLTEEAEKKDIFLSFPYYSIKPYLKMLEEAADDENTISIKITLYRLSNNSEAINLLRRAAKNGKEVTAVVELKARFDESNNINWSRQLEEAGCNIIYGIEGLKIHSKITLITRKTDDDIKYTVHIGTGNYNEKTARSYTDVGIITSDSGICIDAVNYFTGITLSLDQIRYKHLLVAPYNLKSSVINLIREEADKGTEGYICFKMNSMTDKEIMDELALASQSGVNIDLIIRGICCLQPGVSGLTDNIRVHSIVGRFLEHSRIFIFGRGSNRRVYIGSADFMTRNTMRRIEIMTPVYDKAIADELYHMTEYMLRDNVKRSILCSNGEYEHVITDSKPFDSQIYFYNEAYNQTP
ncbi:MAG: polyphosphate kinase 1 [Eubacteriales bacterium]|nr:polyphosphate kinase 1 [Eubacteriales bacterium]